MQNQITEGPILRPLLFYFFPILLGTFFQQFYNTVDAIIVGNFVGTAALGAVGGATSVIINFLVNLFVGLSSGATVVIARYYGARQGEELRKAVHTAAAIALTAGVLITALGLVLADPVLRLMGTPSDVMGYAQVYLKVYFSGTIASFIYIMGSSVLRVAWVLVVLPHFPVLETVLVSYPISWVVTSILYLVYYFRGNWLRRGIQRAGLPPEETAVVK